MSLELPDPSNATALLAALRAERALRVEAERTAQRALEALLATNS